jgi:hypothetical protein
VLDENGKDVTSEQIADLIGDAGNTVYSATLCSLRYPLLFHDSHFAISSFNCCKISRNYRSVNYVLKYNRGCQGSHFVLVAHMVLGCKCVSVQMQQLGCPHWF